MMKKNCLVLSLIAVTLLSACGSNSRREEIESRKAALKHKQDSTLTATQQRLAVVDSTLEAVKRQCEEAETAVARHRDQLKATEQELTALTQLRLRRDSLQVEWEVLGAKIKYIKKKQQEL